MGDRGELMVEARQAATALLRKVNQSGPASLSQTEQKVLGWVVRVLERSAGLPVDPRPTEPAPQPLGVLG
jgi:hypothetical protein